MASYADFSNTKLGFKIGLQSGITSMINSKNATEGIFYLTSDTHRLYIGRKVSGGSDIIPVPVNEGITVVNAVANLPSAVGAAQPGEFYYCSTERVLAVCSGLSSTGAPTWLQLNQDTTLDNESSSITVGAVSSNASKITVKVADTNAAVADVSKDFTIAGGTNVTLSASGSTLTIAAEDHTYSMGAAADGTGKAKITLTCGTDVETVHLAADEYAGTLTYSTNASSESVITLNGINYNLTGASVATGNKAGTSTNGFNIGVSANSNTVKADFDPQIKINSSATAVHFVDGVATLDGYTASEVDAKILAAKNTMNAMTYCGTVSSYAGLTGKTAHNGDTYKVAEAFQMGTGGAMAEVGDLIIIQGTEDANGVVTSPTYEVVPSGDEITVSVVATTAGDGIVIKGSRNGDAASTLGSVSVVSGDSTDGLTASYSGTNEKVITLSHKAVTLSTTDGTAITQNDGESKTFTVVTSASIDAYGHLKSIEKTSVTVKDTHMAITSITYSAAVASGVATVTNTIKTSDDTTGKTGTFKLASESLTVGVDGSDASKVTMELVWGTF